LQLSLRWPKYLEVATAAVFATLRDGAPVCITMQHNPVRHRMAGYVCSTLKLISALVLLGLSAAAAADGHRMDLLTLYERASENDPEYAAALADFDAARTAISLARSNVRPQASIGYRGSYNDVNSDSSGNYINHGPTLSLRQTIFNRIHLATIDQAKATMRQAEAQLEAQKQELVLRVAQAYFDVLQAEVDFDFRRSELDAIERQKEQNERRFDVGLVAITDVKDAQAQFDLATAQEIAADNRLESAREALRVITGVEINELAKLSDSAPLLPPAPEDVTEWEALALEQNLPLIVAGLAVRSAEAEVDGSRAERYPTLDLVGLASSNTTDHDLRSDVDSGELRLELNLPLLTGGRTNALVRQAKARERAARHQLDLQKRRTLQETRNAYRNVIANIAQANALKQALDSTQKSLEAQEAGFDEGLLTSLEVLRSLRDTFSAQSDYAAARYQYIVNTLFLKRAAGTLGEPDVRQINGWLSSAGNSDSDSSATD